MTIGLSQTQEETNHSATGHAKEKKWVEEQREIALLATGLARRMKLRELFEGAEVTIPAGFGEQEIQHVACDSRKVSAGALFFALHGGQADGNMFIRDAVSRGAVAIA